MSNLPQGLMFMKGLMKDKAPTFHEWDKPVDREVDGKLIKGRPTLGYGDFSFEYAGKYRSHVLGQTMQRCRIFEKLQPR